MREEPSTDEVIIDNAKRGKNLIVVPIAFVSEHSETLVELDIEYEKLAKKNGCKNYTRIEALGVNENFIQTEENLIIMKLSLMILRLALADIILHLK